MEYPILKQTRDKGGGGGTPILVFWAPAIDRKIVESKETSMHRSPLNQGSRNRSSKQPVGNDSFYTKNDKQVMPIYGNS